MININIIQATETTWSYWPRGLISLGGGGLACWLWPGRQGMWRDWLRLTIERLDNKAEREDTQNRESLLDEVWCSLAVVPLLLVTTTSPASAPSREAAQ
ncbi:hypothetical protein JHW43_004416 [Diplocarpon mali]|nr:hypothetical protein JHW43_004416 [Diplocarpon mali]